MSRHITIWTTDTETKTKVKQATIQLEGEAYALSQMRDFGSRLETTLFETNESALDAATFVAMVAELLQKKGAVVIVDDGYPEEEPSKVVTWHLGDEVRQITIFPTPLPSEETPEEAVLQRLRDHLYSIFSHLLYETSEELEKIYLEFYKLNKKNKEKKEKSPALWKIDMADALSDLLPECIIESWSFESCLFEKEGKLTYEHTNSFLRKLFEATEKRSGINGNFGTIPFKAWEKEGLVRFTANEQELLELIN